MFNLKGRLLQLCVTDLGKLIIIYKSNKMFVFVCVAKDLADRYNDIVLLQCVASYRSKKDLIPSPSEEKLLLEKDAKRGL